jgi:hypothetical protein
MNPNSAVSYIIQVIRAQIIGTVATMADPTQTHVNRALESTEA